MIQEKKDGMRLGIYTDAAGRGTFLNRDGAVTTKVPRGTVLPTLPPLSYLDTEFIWATKRPCLLDVLMWNGEDWRMRPALHRYQAAVLLAEHLPLVDVVSCAVTLGDKARLIARLREERAEGLIFKDATAPYYPGRSLNRVILRVKWRKRLEAVCLRRETDTKRSFEMFLYEAGQPVHVGSVSAHNYYEALTPGQSAVAEISYLYASKRRQLTQPSVEQWRTDKAPDACTIDQLVIGKRFTEEAA